MQCTSGDEKSELARRLGEPGPKAGGRTASRYQLERRRIVEQGNLHADVRGNRLRTASDREGSRVEIDGNAFAECVAGVTSGYFQDDLSRALLGNGGQSSEAVSKRVQAMALRPAFNGEPLILSLIHI